MLIKDHITYNDFFRKAAYFHKAIRHRDDQVHFARINLSSHPMLAREDITEFLRSMHNKLLFPALLVNTYQLRLDHSDSRDAKRAHVQGEFFILDRYHKDDFDHQEQVFQITEKIGADIIALLGEYYEEQPWEGLFEWSDVLSEKISNLHFDNLAGTKYYFTISIPREVATQLNTDAFDPNLFDQ